MRSKKKRIDWQRSVTGGGNCERPAFRANYPEEYELVLGGLKALGVKHIISVAFGADITTWGYLRYINEHDFTGGISQPCPAVVTYIEKYLPELLPNLNELEHIYRSMGKETRESRKINCTSCGYNTCLRLSMMICWMFSTVVTPWNFSRKRSRSRRGSMFPVPFWISRALRASMRPTVMTCGKRPF